MSKQVVAKPVTVKTVQSFTRPSRPVPKFETKKFGREVSAAQIKVQEKK